MKNYPFLLFFFSLNAIIDSEFVKDFLKRRKGKTSGFVLLPAMESPKFFVRLRIDLRERKYFFREFEVLQVSWRHIRRENFRDVCQDVCTVEIQPDQYEGTMIYDGLLHEAWLLVYDDDGNCWGQFEHFASTYFVQDHLCFGTLQQTVPVQYVEKWYLRDRASRTIQRLWRLNCLLKYLTLTQIRRSLDNVLPNEVTDRIMCFAVKPRRITYQNIRNSLMKND